MSALVERLGRAPTVQIAREPPDLIEVIVVVGGTCAGKTTLVDAVRRAAIMGLIAGLDVPQRFVTRAPRADDVATEAGYVTEGELDAAIASGAVYVHWRRTLEPGHSERYGFARPAGGTRPVYSANNAIYQAGNVRPSDALARALLVGVFAPEAVREHRLHVRSPALCRDRPAEAGARLADPSDSMLSHVHAVIENHGSQEAAAKHDIVSLVRAAFDC
jgi:ribose 1,5-bisphosphokinase PhnN